jgi:hypothetical protein
MFQEGAGPKLADGSRVSAETSRRLACDSARMVMRHAGDGRVLDVGRRTRAISPGLRRSIATAAAASRSGRACQSCFSMITVWRDEGG